MSIVYHGWKINQTEVLQQLATMNGSLILEGDGRSDSPGHWARYGFIPGLRKALIKLSTFSSFRYIYYFVLCYYFSQVLLYNEMTCKNMMESILNNCHFSYLNLITSKVKETLNIQLLL